MKKIVSIILAAAFAAASVNVIAQDKKGKAEDKKSAADAKKADKKKGAGK